MNSYQTLKNIIGKANKKELSSFQKLMLMNVDEIPDTGLVAPKMIEGILSNPSITAGEMQKKLYGKMQYEAFAKLVNRTKDKILEALVLDNNLKRTDIHIERNQVLFDIRKKQIQIQILQSRGFNQEIESMRDRLIERAKKYELYDQLLELLYDKQMFSGFRYGLKVATKIKEEIEYFEKCRYAAQKARIMFAELSAKINSSASADEYKNDLPYSVGILRDDYKVTKSGSVGYYFYLFETELHQQNENYHGAEKSLQALITLLHDNPSIYLKHRMGNTLINIANNEIYIGKFDDAQKHASASLEYLSSSAVNKSIVREIEFFIAFYNGDLDLAIKIIDELYTNAQFRNTASINNRRAYMYAAVFTAKGDYKNSLKLLSEMKEIEKDKEGWNLARRILTIINEIELEEFENTELKIQSLNVFIKRILKNKFLPERYVKILRLLLRLIQLDFDFEKTYRSRKKYFDEIADEKSSWTWKVKSPELIVFHEWFQSKIDKKKYDHHAVMKKLFSSLS